MPSIPGLPLLAFTRRNACWQFSRPQTSSINCSAPAGLSVSHFAVNDSVPFRGALGASLRPSPVKASAICSWFFCHLSSIEACLLLAAPGCLGLRPCGLLCPLLTPAPRSEWIAPPPVSVDLQCRVLNQAGTPVPGLLAAHAMVFCRLEQIEQGKIMRRLLRELATSGDVKGDTTTPEDSSIIARLKEQEEARH